MNRSDQHAIISQAILDVVPSGWQTLFGNVLYTGDSDKWLRVTIRSDKEQIAMPDVFRYFGTVFVQVFCRSDVGVGDSLRLVDLLDSLSGTIVDGIRLTSSSCDPVGESDGWFGTVWTIDFNHEE